MIYLGGGICNGKSELDLGFTSQWIVICGLALAFTFRASRRWIAEIAGRREHREETSHVELVVPVGSDVFHLGNNSSSPRFSPK